MKTVKITCLVWQDTQGWYTGVDIEGYQVWANGSTERTVLEQLREALMERFRRDPWMIDPEYTNARTETHVVRLRPQYHDRERTYSSDERYDLRTLAVLAEDADKSKVCILPMMDRLFYYYDDKSLPDLVRHHVMESLERATPEDLLRRLPPQSHALHEVVLRVRPTRQTESDDAPSTETLRQVAEAMGDDLLRRQYARAWERAPEVTALAKRLTSEGTDLLLVGPSGVGKTALLIDAVRSVERGQGKAPRFWLTSGQRLIAGMAYLGQWEERVETVIDELSQIRGVLCVDRLVDLVLTSTGDPASSVANFILPYMQHQELRVIAEATPAEVEQIRRLLPGFVEQFQVVVVPEFEADAAERIMQHLAEQALLSQRVETDANVGPRLDRLFRRFMPYRVFPGPVTGFYRQLVDGARRQPEPRVTEADVVRRFARDTGLPDFLLQDDTVLQYEEAVARLQARVIGQDSACERAAGVVTTFKAGLNNPSRPVGVMIFAGPTGVGKTQLARTLSDLLYGHGSERDRLIRLDMSEYAGPNAVDRLVAGSNGGPSAFIQRMRRQPFGVVLLDEIEKASPAVFDLLLNVLDEGRLSDRSGRSTWFRSAIVIMTTNLGAAATSVRGFSAAPDSAARDAISQFFRPEFLNRVDHIVDFAPLSAEHVAAITRLELAEVAGREGIVTRELRLSWSDALVAHLAAAGFDPRYGARPLQRTIEREVVAPLAAWLLAHPGVHSAALTLDLDDAGALSVVVSP